MKKLLAVLLFAFTLPAAGQAPVKQSGTVTPGHATSWTTTGVVQDAGTAANGKLTSLGITASGPSFCINSALITSAGWQQFCFGVTTAGGGTISVQNFGTALPKPFTVTVNGTPYQFPFSLAGILGPNSSVINNFACWNNTVGTLLSDCGLSSTGTNTWTGLQNFNGGVAVNGSPLTINPTAATINQGLVITQTSPATGSTTGPLNFNLLNITDSIQVPAPSSDSTGNAAAANGFRVNTLFTGNNLAGSGVLVSGLFTATVGPTTFSGDIVGFAGTAYTNTSFNGAFLEGINAIGQVGPSGFSAIVVGLDAGAAILAGGSATNRVGIDINSFGAVQASGVDAALAIIGGSATTPWKKVFAFSNFAGQPGVGTTTDMFWADTSYTIANVFNLSNMTVSGNILAFPNMGIAGNGNATFGIPIGSLSAGFNVQISGTSEGRIGFAVNTNTTTGLSQIDLSTSAGVNSNELNIGLSEAARTTTNFGITTGNWGQFVTAGSANLGLLFGTISNTPIVLGTNNTEAFRILGTQVLKFAGASFTANGSVATALSSVGPAGSHTTVQEWFTVQDSAGTVRYIPAF